MSKKKASRSGLLSRLIPGVVEVVALRKLAGAVGKKGRGGKGRGLLKRGRSQESGGKRKVLAGSVAAATLLFLWKRRKARRAGRRLRNDQGVGPAHIKGVSRGEELAAKKGVETTEQAPGRPGSADPDGHTAGRSIDSIHPA